jgi:uncharacterized protein (TIGR03086 family)
MSVEVFRKACATTSMVLTGISALQMAETTPCSAWRIRDLINHVVGGLAYFAVTAETGMAPMRGDDPDMGSTGFTGAFDRASERVVRAFSKEGVLLGSLQFPFGDIPANVFLLIAATDVFTHGWDLAKATGQPTDLDAEVATALLCTARTIITDSMRGPETAAPYGP